MALRILGIPPIAGSISALWTSRTTSSISVILSHLFPMVTTCSLPSKVCTLAHRTTATTLTEYLKGLDWSVAQSASLEDCVAVLQTHASSAIEKLAPLKTISPAKNRHPWFNIDHRTLIQERDRLYKRFRRTRLAEDLLVYRQARDLAHRKIEEARQNYHYTRLSQQTDPKDIWRELEHLGISSKKNSPALPFLINALNAHFRSVSDDQDTPPVTDFLHSLTSSNSEQFIFDEVL